MFDQCEALIIGLQKRGAVVGSSLNTAYLLERLSQTLERLETLMAILFQIAITAIESYY